ncbi:MAG: hypothetical protein Q9191_003547 [Dirinaria sp. TL-2023a]
MPQLRNLSVHITDAEGQELEEWAVQHFPKHNKVSAYIKAQSNLTFKVAVQAKIPYVDEDIASQPTGRTDAEGGQWHRHVSYPDLESRTSLRNPKQSYSHHTGNRSQDLTNNDGDSCQFRHGGTRYSSSPIRVPSPIHIPSPHGKPPPYHFLASLYLDGRRKVERRVIVYLDPEHEDFSADGKSMLTSRLVRAEDGTIQEHAWVFNEIGIDIILNTLFISEDQAEMEAEDELTAAMNTAALHPENDMEREGKKGVGQIEVIVERVVLRRKWTNYDYQPKHREGEAEDAVMSGTTIGLTHTAGSVPVEQMFELLTDTVSVAKTKTNCSNHVPVVSYELYNKDERPFASFKFFYRSQEILEKLIPEFPRSPENSHRTRGPIDANFSSKVPLSIARGLPLTPKSARYEGVSYEDQIEHRRLAKGPNARRSNALGRLEEAGVKAHDPTSIHQQIDLSDTSQHLNRDRDDEDALKGRAQYLGSRHSKEEDTASSSATDSKYPAASLDQAPVKNDKALVLHSRPDIQQVDLRASKAHESTAISPTGPENLVKDSDKQRKSKAPDRNAAFKSPKFTPPDRPKHGFTKINVSHHADTSSDADDEWDKDDSDLKTHLGEDDQDAIEDLIPSQDQDDEGLHHGINNLTLKGPGKRQHDGDSNVGDNSRGGLEGGGTGDRVREDASQVDGGDGVGMDDRSSGTPTKTIEGAGKQAAGDPEQQSKRMKTQA